MLRNSLLKVVGIFALILFFNFTYAQKAYQVKDIPDPKNNGGGWVSNPDGILSADDVANINSSISNFAAKSNVQAAVVIVNDFDKDQEDFDFAYELFNTWGIGQKTSNNGLLLFISKDRRKYRFITGTGTEGVLPDVKLKHIAEQNLIPAFRENDFGKGIINTIDAIGVIILNPENKSELNQFFTQQDEHNDLGDVWVPVIVIILAFIGVFKLVNKQAKKTTNLKGKGNTDLEKTITSGCAGFFMFMFISIFAMVFFNGFGLFERVKLAHAPFILYGILAVGLFFRYIFHISTLRKTHIDDKNFFNAVTDFNKKNFWLVIFSPLILFTLINYLFKRAKNIDRFTPILDNKNREMIRVDRDINIEGKPFLSGGQRAEEVAKTYDYDIWESTDRKEHIIKQWPAEEYNGYTECPKCGFRTYKLNKQVTVTAATYSHDGQAKLINECSCCKNVEFIKWITLAMLVESKSSSSSSSSSSGSSSSSSSWGGGRSSGGGTGGSW
ncbi:TPM domain-containing protein [Pedobacter frigidisoli]|uniref:TPM domain-containing protein n=1 Tax=Pedobacter frigidisoli TaxID=2530455 RepID=A0A4R0NZD8_9SPHI|nr:TPM domain-containing protein [Pedobacter frigidisoli]TCD04474.1 TPM domain-containing protein [Pedobacter frigidisoli]